MRYETKFAVVVRTDLAIWQKLNVTAFLSGGLGGQHREVLGEPYRDASGQAYNALVRQPIMVFQAESHEMGRTLERALRRGLTPAIYTADLFQTYNDADNRAAVAGVATADLDLVGIGLYGDRRSVDKITKGLDLHG